MLTMLKSSWRTNCATQSSSSGDAALVVNWLPVLAAWSADHGRSATTRLPRSTSTAGWRPLRSQSRARVDRDPREAPDAPHACARAQLAAVVAALHEVGDREQRDPEADRAHDDPHGPVVSPAVRGAEENVASVFGSPQFARPPSSDASESTAMNGIVSSGPRRPTRMPGVAHTSAYGPTGLSR